MRDQPDFPDHDDIEIEIEIESTAEYAERGLDALQYRNSDQFPYMTIFDVNQVGSVSFDEYMTPISAAAFRADADRNGILDDVEQAAIEDRSEALGDMLESVEGKYGFATSVAD